MPKQFLIFLLPLFFLSPTWAEPKAVKDFRYLMQKFSREISLSHQYGLMSDPLFKRLSLGLQRVGEIQAKDQAIYLDGEEKIAVNLSSKMDRAKKDILISSPSWEKLNRRIQYSLTIHELSLIAGYDDRNYEVSKYLISHISCLEEVRRHFLLQVRNKLLIDDQEFTIIPAREETIRDCALITDRLFALLTGG